MCELNPHTSPERQETLLSPWGRNWGTQRWVTHWNFQQPVTAGPSEVPVPRLSTTLTKALEHPEGWVSDPAGLGWSPRICMSNKFPGAAAPGTNAVSRGPRTHRLSAVSMPLDGDTSLTTPAFCNSTIAHRHYKHLFTGFQKQSIYRWKTTTLWANAKY